MFGVPNAAIEILRESARLDHSFSDLRRISALTEAETIAVSNVMVSNLYKSVIDKSHVDFEDIPASKGDITKYNGYETMMDCLNCLKSLAEKSSVKIPEIEIIEKAINNVIVHRSHFQRGFALGKDYIMLQYNVIVAACVEGTSELISSYVDFIKRVDQIEFVLINAKTRYGKLAIKNLENFNKSCSDGSFTKIMDTIIKTGSESLTGAAMVVIPVVIIGAVVLAIIGIRELIFYFYYTRMKLSDYLKLQATFLELNKNNVEANSGIPVKKRNEILKKQEKLSEKLRAMADKIKVDGVATTNTVNAEIKKENSGWKIRDVESDAASSDSNGYQLL